MEIKLKDFIKPSQVIAFVNFNGSFKNLESNQKIFYVLDDKKSHDKIVRDYFIEKIIDFSESKFQDACKMVLLDYSVLDKNWNQLSKTEMKRLQFVEALLNRSETILFQNFELGFYGKDRSYYQKLFVKLTKYGKCILCFTNDITFLFGMVSNFILFRENDYIFVNDFYEDEIYQYIEMPPIISLIKNLNQKNIKLGSYIETKEVLKAIYRSVNAGDKL